MNPPSGSTEKLALFDQGERDYPAVMVATQSATFRSYMDTSGTVDRVGIEERVLKFTARSIKRQSKLWGLYRAVSMIDLTALEGKDTPGRSGQSPDRFAQ